MKTFTVKGEYSGREWLLVDAKGKVLGRMASQIAAMLRGKHKPVFSPHIDVGDFIVVINADKIRVSGRKAFQKEYFHHTGYPGALKKKTYQQVLSQHPEFIIKHAVKGMLPHNRLGRKLLKKLKIYQGEIHPHNAQKPKPVEL